MGVQVVVLVLQYVLCEGVFLIIFNYGFYNLWFCYMESELMNWMLLC